MILFLSATNSIYAPLAANLYLKSEMQRLSSILKTTTRWVSYATIPIFIFVTFSAKDIMMMFGKEYAETGYTVLIILSFGQLINCVTGGVGFTLTMTGKQKIELINSLGLVLIKIVLNLLLIQKYGIVGAAVAMVISVILINFLRLLEIYKLYQIHPYSKRYIKTLIPPGIAILLMLCVKVFQVHYMWNALMNIIVIILSFMMYLKVFGFDDEERYVLNLIKRKLSTE